MFMERIALIRYYFITVSISSTFYVQIFRTSFGFLVTFWLCQKIRTKNSYVKGWWNWRQLSIFVPFCFFSWRITKELVLYGLGHMIWWKHLNLFGKLLALLWILPTGMKVINFKLKINIKYVYVYKWDIWRFKKFVGDSDRVFHFF